MFETRGGEYCRRIMSLKWCDFSGFCAIHQKVFFRLNWRRAKKSAELCACSFECAIHMGLCNKIFALSVHRNKWPADRRGQKSAMAIIARVSDKIYQSEMDRATRPHFRGMWNVDKIQAIWNWTPMGKMWERHQRRPKSDISSLTYTNRWTELVTS